MSRLTGTISVFQDTLDIPAGTTIAGGNPVTSAGAVTGAGGQVRGIAMADVNNATEVVTIPILVVGRCRLKGGGVITADTWIKVGTGGKFIVADATDYAAGITCGRSIEACAGDGSYFDAYIGVK